MQNLIVKYDFISQRKQIKNAMKELIKQALDNDEYKRVFKGKVYHWQIKLEFDLGYIPDKNVEEYARTGVPYINNEIKRTYSRYHVKALENLNEMDYSNQEKYFNENLNLVKDHYDSDSVKLKSLYIIIEERGFNKMVLNKKKDFETNQLRGFYTKPKNNNFQGSSYSELPDTLKYLHCLLNIKNKDNMCFLWCILASLNINKVDKKRQNSPKSYYDFINQVDTCMLEYPVNCKSLDNFCLVNKLYITVWKLDMPIFKTKMSFDNLNLEKLYEAPIFLKTQDKKINLLLYNNHYILIKKIDCLVRFVYNLNSKVYVCECCNNVYFYSQAAYEKHVNVCMLDDDDMKYELPKNNYDIRFRNTQNEIKSLFCLYSDFESILFPYTQNEAGETIKINNHKPIALGCLLVDSFNNKIIENTFSGFECPNNFLDYIESVTFTSKEVFNLILNSYKPSYSKIVRDTECYLCKLKESTKGRVVILGRQLIIHNSCLKRLLRRICSIKVLFHNLKGYDSHFIVDSFGKKCQYFSAIPISKEKYIAFQGVINNTTIRFLDSLAFLQGSLSSNASKLKNFKFIEKYFIQNINNSNTNNLFLDCIKNTGKQIFPYEYLDSIDKLDKEIPKDCSQWFSKLTNSGPTQEEVDKTIKYSNEILNIFTLNDYMLFYLRIDVLLLFEIYENFREMSYNQYNLDPSHYYTTPGFAWDASLKFSKQVLEPLQTTEMINFFCQKGTIRGGISTVSEVKWASTEEKDESIFYYDVTNLYGYAMTFPLPVSNFTIINSPLQDQINNCIYNWNFDNELGYILEVDINIPVELHDYFNELPPLPEHYNNRLTPTLMNKTNYRLHICLLQQSLKLGLQLIRVHTIIQFKQKAWLKDYIQTNTDLRSKTKDENLRNFYKLMNNAVYGKTM